VLKNLSAPEFRIKLPDGRILSGASLGPCGGKPLFLFHGFPGSRYQRPLDMALLEELNVRLISLDRPGIGRSTFMPKRVLKDWPADVSRVADEFGYEQFSVIGNSAGGPYALSCAALLPERVLSCVTVGSLAPLSLMLKLKPYNRAGTFFRFVRRFPVVALLLLFGGRQFLRRTSFFPTPDFINRQSAADQELLRERWFAKHLLEDFRESFYPGVRGHIHDAQVLSSSWGFGFRDIQVPVHLFHSPEDKVVPFVFSEAMAKAIPGAELHTVKESGHYHLPIRKLREILERLPTH
jgi:pimeloyl-ACP methyl ester carboxylesterase